MNKQYVLMIVSICALVLPGCSCGAGNGSCNKKNQQNQKTAASVGVDKIQEIKLSIRKDSDRIWSKFHKDLEQLHTILLPQNLCDYEQLLKSKQVITDCSASLNNSLKEAFSLIANQQKNIIKLANDNQNAGTIDFNEEYRLTKLDAKVVSQFAQLESEIFSKLNEIVDFFLARFAFCEVQSGKVAFDMEEDLEKYNALMTDFVSLVEKEHNFFGVMKEIDAKNTK